jgi:hypothetical protein
VPRTLLLGVALIAATTLMLELLLTRVFDVVLLPNTAYMVITCAVFAYGLAGLYVTVRPFPEQLSVDRVAAVLTLLVAGTSVLLLPAVNIIPFKGLPFNQGSWKRELVSFIAVYAALVVPFFLAGLTVTTVFQPACERHPAPLCVGSRWRGRRVSGRRPLAAQTWGRRAPLRHRGTCIPGVSGHRPETGVGAWCRLHGCGMRKRTVRRASASS